MFIFNLIPKAYAGTLPLGPVTGVGKFQQYVGSGAGNVTLFESLISKILGILTIMAGISLIVYLMLGALNWITSAGDKGKVEKAQQQITNAILGVVVVVLAYFILGIVSTILDVPFLDLNSIL